MFDDECKKALLQMRDFLKDLDQKIFHLIEQGREDRSVLDNVKVYDDDD